MKYLLLVFLIAIVATLGRAVYPTVKITNECMTNFTKELPSKMILTRVGNSESTKNFCTQNLKSINNVNICLNKSRQEEKIKGVTNSVKKIIEATTISGEEISSTIKGHNKMCQSFPDLNITE